jgi:organic radical activating enzyme
MSAAVLKLSRLPSGEPEIFSSIQGEGVSAGTPSVFVRLALCNLRCAWCDTAYTWDWERFSQQEQVLDLPVEEVVGRVTSAGLPNVVITGGEPLLQPAALGRLAVSLKAAGRHIEVETNGTLVPDDCLTDAVAQWNVSPKLGNSANPRAKRLVPRSLAWFAEHPRAYFKLVVAEPADVDEVQDLVLQLGLPSDRVLLMPEAIDAEQLRERSAWLVDLCRESGFRFGTRLHILLWGNTRGR